MEINKDDIPRVALGSLISILGAISLTKAGGLNDSILRWLMFGIGCGCVINKDNSSRFVFTLFASLISTLVFILVICWAAMISVITGAMPPNMSTVPIDFNIYSMRSVVFIGLIYTVTTILIVASAYSRPLIFGILDAFSRIRTEDAQRWEVLVNLVIKIATVSLTAIWALAV